MFWIVFAFTSLILASSAHAQLKLGESRDRVMRQLFPLENVDSLLKTDLREFGADLELGQEVKRPASIWVKIDSTDRLVYFRVDMKIDSQGYAQIMFDAKAQSEATLLAPKWPNHITLFRALDYDQSMQYDTQTSEMVLEYWPPRQAPLKR